MEVFNIGALEVVFIVLLAFIVLGPQKAVEAAGDLGRWIRKVVKSPFWRNLVSTSQDIKDIPRKLMDDAEIQQTLEEIERSTREMNTQLHGSQAEGKSNAVNKSEGPEEEHRIMPEDLGH